MVVRLQGDRRGGLARLALAGLFLVGLFPLEVLGWCGVLAMSRDGWGAFATLATLALGAIVLVGAIALGWGWAELEFSDEAIRVTQGVARWARRSERISRPPPGTPMTAMVERESPRRGTLVYYLRVVDGVRSTPLEIGRYLHVDQERLREVAIEIELWVSQRA
jgi:hypothetical protein